MKCPLCGTTIAQWRASNNRERGYCACNPTGAVVDRPRPVKPRRAEVPPIPGLGPELTTLLTRLGYTDAPAICAKRDEDLLALPGLGARRVAQLRAWCEQQEVKDDSSE